MSPGLAVLLLASKNFFFGCFTSNIFVYVCLCGGMRKEERNLGC